MPGYFDWLSPKNEKSLFEREVELEVEHLRAVDKALDGPYGSNAELYASTMKLIEEAKFPGAETFAKRTFLRFLDRCEELNVPFPHYNIILQMGEATAVLYAAERLDNRPPNPAVYGYSGDTKSLGIFRDILIGLQRKAARPAVTLDVLTNSIVASFVSIARQLPPIAQDADDEDESLTAMNLIDLLKNAPSIVEAAIEPYDSPEARNLGLFRSLKDQLRENSAAVAETKRSKHPVPPSQYDGSPSEVVAAYLKATPLEALLLEPRIPFSLPEQTRFAGHWIIAPPGRGKTTLLHSMVMDDLKKDATVILMDSKGDLIEPFYALKELSDRLIIIDPDLENPLALNPLDIPKDNIDFAIDQLEYLFSSLLDSKMTANQRVLFRNVFRLLTIVPGATLETFRDLLQNGYEKYADYVGGLPQRAQDFFFKEFNFKPYDDRRKEVIARLRALLDYSDIMSAMLTAATTRFKMADAMDSGKVVIINNSKARLGEDGAEFFGRFFIAQVLAAAQQRAGRAASAKKPVYFYIDECQNVISRDERIPTILDECRSQKVALILAHQRTQQIASANVLSAISNCAIRYANSDDEARFLSAKLRCAPEFLQNLKRGEFAAFVRDMTPAAITLNVPRVDFSQHAQLTPQECASLKTKMRDRYGVLPAASSPSRPGEPARRKRPPAPVPDRKEQPNDPDTGSHTKESSSW